MQKIYSKVKPKTLLHIINYKNEITDERQDLCPEQEYLQVACFSLIKGKSFKAHKHLKQLRKSDITQESWIVVTGKIKAILYDLDDTVLREVILEPGDCSITFRGGHNYVSLEEDTTVYEYKTGPYYGQELDKTFIND